MLERLQWQIQQFLKGIPFEVGNTLGENGEVPALCLMIFI
jgi:hypothetical protein